MKELVFSIDTSRSKNLTLLLLRALHLTLFYLLQCNMYLPTYFRIHGAAMPISLDLRNFFRQVFCLSCKSFTIMTIKGPKVKPLKNLFFFIFQFSVAIALPWSFHNISYINNMFFLFPFLRAFFWFLARRFRCLDRRS